MSDGEKDVVVKMRNTSDMELHTMHISSGKVLWMASLHDLLAKPLTLTTANEFISSDDPFEIFGIPSSSRKEKWQTALTRVLDADKESHCIKSRYQDSSFRVYISQTQHFNKTSGISAMVSWISYLKNLTRSLHFLKTNLSGLFNTVPLRL